MNNTVLVEFLFPIGEVEIWEKKFLKLDNDFLLINKVEGEHESDGNKSYLRYSGKITAEYASLIKLQDPYLAGCMRVSYIPDELKDRYRK